MTADHEPLDNPIWHALSSSHRGLAVSSGLAARYIPEIAPFCGLRDGSPEALDDLKQLVASGDTVALFTANALALPYDWNVQRHRRIDQMICKKPTTTSQQQVVNLLPADAPAMSRLIDATQPSPFQPRTIEMGHYYGIRNKAGELVAMAGERLSLDGFVEVSAVCTHPDYRARGFAKTLVSHVSNLIIDSGKIPFLHVKYENDARLLYAALGFEFRASLDLTVITRKQPDTSSCAAIN